MKIYEIDAEIATILDAVDPETGEITDKQFTRLGALQMERDKKIDHIACWYKETLAEAEAIKAEKMSLAERQRMKENQAERLKQWIGYVLNGQKFESSRNRISYRKSQSVNVVDESMIPDEYREPQPDKILKTDISVALKTGREVPGAVLENKVNIQIK